jgi:GH25 family lysozyme M1 (1,4-beta-N-acetylmuramidase)
MSTDFFIIDVSHWDPSVDWKILKSHNVLCAIVKATDGYNGFNQLFHTHCDGAKAEGMVLGAYHFFRPWIDQASIEKQAQFFLDKISSQPIKFIALDLEEYTKNSANKVAPSVYSQRAKAAAVYLRSHSDLPLVVYTRKSFLDIYTPQVYDWLWNFDLWLAHWRYNDTDLHSGRQTITWEELVEKHLPPYSGPTVPPSNNKWTLWQWTGEKYFLPGMITLIDLSYFNGTKEAFFQWANFPADECTAHSEPGDPVLPHAVKVLALIQVHSSPSKTAPVVGNLDMTATPNAFDVCIKDGDKYARIGENQWISMRFKGVKFADWA